MRITVKQYSRLHANVNITHNNVSFEREMMSKHELEEFIQALQCDIEQAEKALEGMAYYDEVTE